MGISHTRSQIYHECFVRNSQRMLSTRTGEPGKEAGILQTVVKRDSKFRQRLAAGLEHSQTRRADQRLWKQILQEDEIVDKLCV